MYLDHRLGDAATGKPVLLLTLIPIRGSSAVLALVRGGRCFFLGSTARPLGPPGDPQVDPKACWGDVGSLCDKAEVTLHVPGHPGRSAAHGRTLLCHWEVTG